MSFTPGPSDTPCSGDVINLINRCINKHAENRPKIDEIINVLGKSWLGLSSEINDLDLFH